VGFANNAASSNSVSCLNYYEIRYKTTPHLFNFDVSFTSDSHSKMEFTNAEVRAVLKLFFVQGETARESHRQNSVVGDGTMWIRTAE